MGDLSNEELKDLASIMEVEDGSTANEYQWDEEVQKYVLGMLLNDRFFLVQSLGLVKPAYFTHEAHKLICGKLFDHFNKYKTVPARIFLVQEIEDALKERDAKVRWHYVSEFNTVYDYYVPGVETRDYLLDKITNFAKNQAIKTAFSECMAELKKDHEKEATWVKVRETLRTALLVERNVDTGLDYFNTVEERLERMAKKAETGEVFTSGFKEIDDALAAGGPQRGELYSFVASSGAGKSLAMTTTSVANLKRGHKVLYISLEMAQDDIGGRFDAQLADIAINETRHRVNDVKAALADIVSDKHDSRLLVIKQFPGGSVDVNGIRAYVSQLAMQGFKPDIIIVDYIGEMKDLPGMEIHMSRQTLVRDLRGFAVEENVCIFTAMQPNRSAKEAQKVGVIDDDNLADSHGMIRPLDGCYTINQTQEEKEAEIARIFISKHRNGKSKIQFYVRYLDTLQISQISKNQYDEARKRHAVEKKVRSMDGTASDINQEIAKRHASNDNYEDVPAFNPDDYKPMSGIGE